MDESNWTLPSSMTERIPGGSYRTPVLANDAPDGDLMPAHAFGSTVERSIDRAVLISAAPDMYAVLVKMEWQSEIAGCPECRQRRGDGHASSCELGKAIRKGEGGSELCEEPPMKKAEKKVKAERPVRGWMLPAWTLPMVIHKLRPGRADIPVIIADARHFKVVPKPAARRKGGR